MAVGPALVPGIDERAGPLDQVHYASIKKAGRGDRDREELRISTLAAGTGQKKPEAGGLPALIVGYRERRSLAPYRLNFGQPIG